MQSRWQAHERYELIIEGSLNKQEALGKLISFLFSNENLYVEASLRRLVATSPRGYVHLEELLPITAIDNYFREFEISSKKTQLLFLGKIIQENCHDLYCSSNRVRRLVPFDFDLLTQIKPLGIDTIKENMTVSDVREYFGNDSFTNTTQIGPNKDEHVFVYAPSYRQRYPTKNDLSNLPFRAIRYETLSYERHRESKFWEDAEQRMYRPVEYKEEHGMSRQGEDEEGEEVDPNDDDRRDYMQNMMDQMGRMPHNDERRWQMMGRMHNYRPDPNHRHREEFEAIVTRPNPEYNQKLMPFIQSHQMRGH